MSDTVATGGASDVGTAGHRDDLRGPFDASETVPGRLDETARRRPDCLAVRGHDAEYTYRQLTEAANGLARLVLESTPPGARVVVFHTHGARILVAIMAVLKAGRICVPVDPAYPVARNRAIFEDAAPAAVLTDTVNVATARTLGEGSATILDLDEACPPPCVESPEVDVSSRDLAYLLYTSGSTGDPKGVAHCHRTLLHDGHRRRLLQGIVPEDRLSLLYSSSVMGAVHGIFTGLVAGASLHVNSVAGASVRGLVHWLREERITVYHSVATLFRELVGSLEPGDVFPDLRLVVFGGERCLRDDLEKVWQWFPDGCEVCAGLGSTETGTVRGWLLTRETEFEGDIVPCGYPVEDVRVEVVADDGQVAEVGLPGEIVVTSPYIFSTYWPAGAATDAATDAAADAAADGAGDRTYRTGDRGLLQADGRLLLLDRADSQVSIRGFRVELGEIEAAALRHPDVRNAAVVCREDDSANGPLAIFAAARHGAELTPRQLRDHLRQRLPDHMVPFGYAIVDDLPMTPNGKTDRSRLRELEAFPVAPAEPYVAPRDELENRLAYIVGQVLDCEPMGIHLNFFDASLTSIAAVRLLTRIEGEFGRPLAVKTLFNAPTVARLAVELRCQAARDPAAAVIPIQADGARPPIICLPGTGGVASFAFRTLAGHVGEDQPFYAVQLQGLDGDRFVRRSAAEMAADRLDLLLRLGFEEPYRLLGYSFGGRLVLEMAHQLRQRGKRVAFLGMIDTRAPGYPGVASWPERYRLHFANLRRMSRRERGQYLRNRLENVGDRIRRIGRRRAAGLLDDKMPFEERVAEMERVTRETARRHEPPIYHGDVTLFRATEHPEWVGASFDDPTNGWSRYVRGNIQVHDVSGEHLELLSGPSVRELGEVLRRSLE